MLEMIVCCITGQRSVLKQTSILFQRPGSEKNGTLIYQVACAANSMVYKQRGDAGTALV